MIKGAYGMINKLNDINMKKIIAVIMSVILLNACSPTDIITSPVETISGSLLTTGFTVWQWHACVDKDNSDECLFD